MAALHVRNHFASEINRAHKIRIHGTAPFLEAGRKKSFCRRSSCISDTNVYAAKFQSHCIDKAMDCLRISYVQGLSEHFVLMFFLDALGGRMQRLSVAGAHRDTASLGGEGLCCGLPDSLAGCGNYRD